MLNWFSYGADASAPKSTDFGIWVTAVNTYDSAPRSVSAYQVQGLNGDIVIDNGRFNNVQVNYSIQLVNTSAANLAAVRQWLCGQIGYQRIYDSYDPFVYREGYYTGNLSFTMNVLRTSGKATITFNCKPQRFKSDANPITWTGYAYKQIPNTTDNPCKPLVRVTGIDTENSLQLSTQIGSDGFTFLMSLSGLPSGRTLWLDFEKQTAYVEAGGNRYNLAVSIMRRTDTQIYVGDTAIPANTTATMYAYAGAAAQFTLWERSWTL